MKKLLYFILIFLSINIYSQVSRGIIEEGLSVKSEILNKNINYSVYLPYDYNSSDRKYPVVYLLHGYTDDETAWLQYGKINQYADKAIAEMEIPPMIIVMPDAGVSWYINSADKKMMYEDFFIKEFIPEIESKFRIRNRKQFRSLAGLSMGGYGSLLYSVKYPDMFSGCAALSAAVYTKDDILNHNQKRWNDVEGVLYGKNLSGKERLTKHLLNNNIIELIKNNSDENLKKLNIYMDCGDDDFLIEGNCILYNLLKRKNVKSEFRIRNGEHNWDYWRSGITEALKYLAKSFNY